MMSQGQIKNEGFPWIKKKVANNHNAMTNNWFMDTSPTDISPTFAKFKIFLIKNFFLKKRAYYIGLFYKILNIFTTI